MPSCIRPEKLLDSPEYGISDAPPRQILLQCSPLRKNKVYLKNVRLNIKEICVILAGSGSPLVSYFLQTPGTSHFGVTYTCLYAYFRIFLSEGRITLC